VIIVNHHLFFADLAVKDDDYGGVIPEYGVVVFDEAHEIEDVAGQYFGVTVSSYQVQDLVRDIAAISRRKQFGSQELDRTLDMLQERAGMFFATFEGAEGREGFRGQAAWLDKNAEKYEDILRALELLGAHLKLVKDSPEEIIPAVRRVEELAGAIRFWMESNNRTYVYWIERRTRSIALQATPIDVASLLEQRLFDKVDSIVLTSATLAVGGNFDFTSARLGVRNARPLIVAGHFDYRRQALLYVPPHLPDPRSPAFPRAAGDE